jgi:hypothetical protein
MTVGFGGAACAGIAANNAGIASRIAASPVRCLCKSFLRSRAHATVDLDLPIRIAVPCRFCPGIRRLRIE